MEKTKGQIAKELFASGYNCAQSVLIAYKDELGLDEQTLAAQASSFGGGIAQLREVCGTVSGGAMVLGMLKGYRTPDDYAAKKEHYARVYAFADDFRAQCGSLVCRDLLSGNVSVNGVPTPRTDEFYKKRPCAELVEISADLVQKYL